MENLRPNKENGDAIALAAIALGVFVLVTTIRLGGPWASMVNLIYTALAAAIVLGLAYLSPSRGKPRAYQTVLYVVGLGLAAIALVNLKDVFGSSSINPPGARVWISLLLVALAGYGSWFRKSGVMTLFAGLLKIVFILSLVEWLFKPNNALETDRWLLAILVFLFIAVVLFTDLVPEKFRQVAVVDAAGFALLALSLTFVGTSAFESFTGAHGTSAGWEILIGLGSLLLIGYAMIAQDPGPGYLGGFNLVAFSAIAASAGDPSFIWWPLVLLIITIAAFAAVVTDQKVPKLADASAFKVTAARTEPAKPVPAKKPAAKKPAAKKSAAKKP
jgi:hypothetical protein